MTSRSPRSALRHRYTLAEGFESFAFFVNSDFSLSGTIFDANNNWTGATSPAGLVSDSAAHVAAAGRPTASTWSASCWTEPWSRRTMT